MIIVKFMARIVLSWGIARLVALHRAQGSAYNGVA